MSFISICNILAWILCAIIAFLLFGDFIKTEIHLAAQRHEETKKAGKEQ